MLHRDWSSHPHLGLADLLSCAGLAELVGTVSLPQGASLGIPSLILSWGLGSWLARYPTCSPLHMHVAETSELQFLR